MSLNNNILEIRNVTKKFPGVVALSNVSFSIKRGEIHGICGENGAGKSTLMKILSGFYPHETYQGEVLMNGEEICFEKGSIRQAIEKGIAIVYQELALSPYMTVGENIFLGYEPVKNRIINWNKLYSDTRKLLARYNLNIPFSSKIIDLGVGKRQMVEIAKALSEKARILILDEPTSALTETEVDKLMDILKTLKENGVTCIYISHRLEEFFKITDSITVLRDGKVVNTVETSTTDTESLISMMVGREMKERFPQREHRVGKSLLKVSGWQVEDPERPGIMVLEDIHFTLRRGEILGIAGLMGSGRTELVTSLFGEYGKPVAGEILLDGKKIVNANARQSMNNGFSLVPEDRKNLGLVLDQSVLKNIALANMDKFSGFMRINRLKELQLCEKFANSLTVKTPNLQVAVQTLSGGNQQKVVISKWLMTDPKILILDDPTRGIDVGAKYEIYKLMNDLVEQGVSIIMVSSELEEVLGMSDRILVMCEGRATGILDGDKANQESIMKLATMTESTTQTA